jgi:hypothetical protein
VRVNAGPPGHASVVAQAGVTLEALLTRLELLGYGVTACPAPGCLALGEALATGDHGTAIAARDEILQAGHSYGGLSNIVLSLTALVWDARQRAYIPRTFEYAVLTRRDRIQHVVSAFYEYLNFRLEACHPRFPVNGPWEARVTGLDDPADCGIAGAAEAWLSPARRPGGRDFDTAVWLTVRSLPGTPDPQRFNADLKEWLFASFGGPDAAVRPIWPTASAADVTSGWAAAAAELEALDPHRVYGDDFEAGDFVS